MSTKTAPPATPADFEQTMTALEALIERMEKGELPLEVALEEFERGIIMTRRCQKILAEAEQKVKMLTEAGEESDFPASKGDPS